VVALGQEGGEALRRQRNGIGSRDADNVEALGASVLDEPRLGGRELLGRKGAQKSRSA
jgi:hypothetical protein